MKPSKRKLEIFSRSYNETRFDQILTLLYFLGDAADFDRNIFIHHEVGASQAWRQLRRNHFRRVSGQFRFVPVKLFFIRLNTFWVRSGKKDQVEKKNSFITTKKLRTLDLESLLLLDTVFEMICANNTFLVTTTLLGRLTQIENFFVAFFERPTRMGECGREMGGGRGREGEGGRGATCARITVMLKRVRTKLLMLMLLLLSLLLLLLLFCC